MPTLPANAESLLVRTDFTDEAAWAHGVVAAMEEDRNGYRPYVTPVSDPAFDGAGWPTVKAAVPHDSSARALFIADSYALDWAEYPFLTVDLLHDNEPFRCVASALATVESNLAVDNLSWSAAGL